MRLSSFEVSGYKNLRRPVRLADLGPINVIHGENNVGKSNLLQATDLFFAMIGSTAHRAAASPTSKTELDEHDTSTAWMLEDGNQVGVRFHVNESSLKGAGFAADDIFHIETPAPIHLRGVIEIDLDDWASAGRLDMPPLAITFDFRISRSHGGCVNVELGIDPAKDPRGEWELLHDIAALIVRGFNVRAGQESRSFVLVDVHRRVPSVDTPGEAGSPRIMPLHLLLALYDAKESVEPGVFQRWEAFENAMSSLGSVVTDGKFVVTYNRATGRAHLAAQKGRTRMPIESMGTGVQQIASLLARALLANSAIVAIEEPELNLRYELQLRLRDALRQIVDSGLGPRQIFLTSHSPAFESGEAFYAMVPHEDGPTVERRPVTEAPAFLQVNIGVAVPANAGAYGYVSSDGLLRLPADIRSLLGVEHGGGVVVLQREGREHVEILNNEQFLSLLHDKGEPT